MRIGIMIEGQEGLTWERWLPLIHAAEDLGYDSLCRSDHLTGVSGQSRRAALETWTSLTVLATRTKRIRFGPLVSPLTFYHPAILAKMATALDTLSLGRLDLGIGAGWNEHEHAMFGVPFPPVEERLDRLERGAARPHPRARGGPARHAQPAPLSAPAAAESYPAARATGGCRLVVGGRGEKRTLRIAAEFADEWNVTRVDLGGLHAQARRCWPSTAAVLRRDPETHHALAHGPARHRPRPGRRGAGASPRARAIFPALPEDEAAGARRAFSRARRTT